MTETDKLSNVFKWSGQRKKGASMNYVHAEEEEVGQKEDMVQELCKGESTGSSKRKKSCVDVLQGSPLRE